MQNEDFFASRCGAGPLAQGDFVNTTEIVLLGERVNTGADAVNRPQRWQSNAFKHRPAIHHPANALRDSLR
ncbi:hypothetical protein NBC2815_02380 [Xanthomonas fragariae]|nr:hypothetical protein NBC2815_02380 [Xanthomonas fragariae]